MKDLNRLLSSDIVLAAAQNLRFDTSHLSDVFESAVVPFGKLSQLIQGLARPELKIFNITLRKRLKVFGDQVTVTITNIEAVLQYSFLEEETLSMLLLAAGDSLTISQKALSIAAAIHKSEAIDLMALLLERAGPSCTLSENVLIAVAKNKDRGVDLLRLFL
jgi:hypothetical protein